GFPDGKGRKAADEAAARRGRSRGDRTPLLIKARPLPHPPVHLNIVLASCDTSLAHTPGARPGELAEYGPVQAEEGLARLAAVVLADVRVADPADQRLHFLLEGRALLRGRDWLGGKPTLDRK